MIRPYTLDTSRLRGRHAAGAALVIAGLLAMSSVGYGGVVGADLTQVGAAESVPTDPAPRGGVQGACCFPDGSCVILDEGTCVFEAGGVFQGAGTTCAGVTCEPFGACCLPDGSCVEDQTAAQCAGQGGIFQGGGTLCGTGGVTCQPFGACCLRDGTCLDTQTALDCAAQNGLYQGNGTVCGGQVVCEPYGACCFSDGYCLESPESVCISENGRYQGDGTECGPGVTCEPFGACCLADGSCVEDRTAAECAALNGMYQGDSTSCGQGSPACVPFGACCLPDGSCVADLTEDDCVSRTGTYQGDGSPCGADEDGDGVLDCSDQCPGTTAGAPVDEDGCSCEQVRQLPNPLDSDGDGVPDLCDACPDTAAGAPVDDDGCSCEQARQQANPLDSDGDGVPDVCDLCPGTAAGAPVDPDGCSCDQRDEEAPVITGCPSSLTIALDAECQYVPPNLPGDLGITDNCTAFENLLIQIEPSDLGLLQMGENTVTVTVSDEAGNASTCVVMVTIEIGDCVTEPPPQPVPPGCDPNEMALNVLVSILFYAPVCGMGCPLMIVATFCGMCMMRFGMTSRRRTPRRDARKVRRTRN